MGLRVKQSEFVRKISQLIIWATDHGYELTFGDAYRSPRAFKGSKPYGRDRSLHKIRLAIDLNLFKDGKWLRETEDHKPLGEYWECIGGTWGGRFNDGNHYSYEHNGRR